jgi:hypothetical protein
MTSGRRLVTLLVVLVLIGTPAVVLRAFCVGRSCDRAAARAPAPFCSLDPATRDLIRNGFRDGRSPDALGVTAATTLLTDVGGRLPVPWPWTTRQTADLRVPLLFRGPDILDGELPGDLGLDQIAPTLERVLGIRRPHADVRAGSAIEGAVRPGSPPAPLVVEIVWKGVGMPDLIASEGAWPFLEGLLGGPVPDGAAGLATAGSIPLDPAAVLTTIGTGGLPSQHGMTGTFVRADGGRVVRAFSGGSPVPVIAALGDDLDHLTGGEAKVGIVATDVSDRGLIGGRWYGGADDDAVVVDATHPGNRVARLLDSGFGADAVPDVLAVVLRGPVARIDGVTRSIVEDVTRRVPRATFVVTATGSLRVDGGSERASNVAAAVRAAAPAIGGTAAGGLFLDERAAAAAGISTQQVVDAMLAQTTSGGAPLFADAFPAFAVRFGRYC